MSELIGRIEQLKPCPFCGEDAEELPERCGISIVRCPSCDIRVYRRSKKEAVAAWNRRAQPNGNCNPAEAAANET